MKDNNDVHLQSTTAQMGQYVTQIIHFKHGTKLTFTGIDTSSIKQGQMTKMKTRDGRMIMVNDVNVLLIEVFPEKE